MAMAMSQALTRQRFLVTGNTSGKLNSLSTVLGKEERCGATHTPGKPHYSGNARGLGRPATKDNNLYLKPTATKSALLGF